MLKLLKVLDSPTKKNTAEKAQELYSPQKKQKNKQSQSPTKKARDSSPYKNGILQPMSPVKKRKSSIMSPQKLRNSSPLKKSSSPLKKSASPQKKKSNILVSMFQKKQKKLNTDNILKLFQASNNDPEKFYKNLTREEQQIYRVLNKETVDLKCEEDSDMAIMVLKKVVKNKMEYEFMRKVIEGLSIFQKNPELIKSEKLNHKLLNNLKYQHFEKFDTIFEMDDIGHEYYIILKGNVECLIKKNKTTDDQQSLDSQKNQQHQFYNKLYPKLFSVKTFTAGESFGEIALLTNQKRTATMVCSTDVDVMTLSKDVFNMIMGDYNEKIMNEKVNFLKGFSFLKDIPTFQLLQLMHNIKEAKYKHNNVIYEENDNVNNIFFIREGQVQITKEIDQSQEQNKLQHQIQHNKQTIKIMDLGPNSYFGDEEIYRNSNKRLNQATCISYSLQILKIKKDKLISFLTHKKMFGVFLSDLKMKYSFREKRQTQILQAIEKEQLQKQQQKEVDQALVYLKNKDKDKKQDFIIRNKGKVFSQFNSNNQSSNQIQQYSSATNLDIKQLKLYQIQHDNGNTQEEDINLHILSDTNRVVNQQRKDSRKFSSKHLQQVNSFKQQKEKTVLKGEFIDKFQQQVDNKQQIFEKLQHQQQIRSNTNKMNKRNSQQQQQLQQDLVSFDDFIPQKAQRQSQIQRQHIIQNQQQSNNKQLNRNQIYGSHSAQRYGNQTVSNFNVSKQSSQSVQRMKQKVLNEKQQSNIFFNKNSQKNIGKQQTSQNNFLKPLQQKQVRQNSSVHYIQTPSGVNKNHYIRNSQQNLKNNYNNNNSPQHQEYYQGNNSNNNNTNNSNSNNENQIQNQNQDNQYSRKTSNQNNLVRKTSQGNKENIQNQDINYNNFLAKKNNEKFQQENQLKMIQNYDLQQDVQQNQVPHTLAAFYKKANTHESKNSKQAYLLNNNNLNSKITFGNKQNPLKSIKVKAKQSNNNNNNNIQNL